MHKLTNIKRILLDCTAATAIEYGLIIALITLVALAAIGGVADETTSMWDDVNTKASDAMGNS